MEETKNNIDVKETPVVLEAQKVNEECEHDYSNDINNKNIGIDYKDMKNLIKNKYEDVKNKYNKIFVLQHKFNENKIVELRAATSTQACKFIHWKPQQVRVLQVKDVVVEKTSVSLN